MDTNWYLSKKCQVILLKIPILIVIYFAFFNKNNILDEDKAGTISPKLFYHIRNKRESTRRFSRQQREESMKLDNETECLIPKMDPFDHSITQFEKDQSNVVCRNEMNWVRCNFSECRVREIILNNYRNVACDYYDVIYDNDHDSHFGKKVTLVGDEVYELKKSDHVKAFCFENIDPRDQAENWSGILIGYRKNVKIENPRPDRQTMLNVLIFAFDSTSKNAFIRRMPRSYEVFQAELGAVILNGYNIVGDATTAAIFPILTGKNEFELPDIRKGFTNRANDHLPWIFYKLRDDGYRTAYFEDMPWIGTFQLRHNGWEKQPTHYYSRHFFVQDSKSPNKKSRYCFGDTPIYTLMMNLTTDFFKMKGKKFCFTFIVNLTHDNYNIIQTADGGMVDFLRSFKRDGRLEDTFLIVMGDHGPRYASVRNTYIGQLEERHPLMAIVLPKRLKEKRPDALKALKSNVDVLTTPYDIYATILDVVRMRNKWDMYKEPGAKITRGLTLLQPVPRSRSCDDAGVEPHWCTCLRRQKIPRSDPIFRKAAIALVDYINFLIKNDTRSCKHRYLKAVNYVVLHLPSSRPQKSMVGKEHYTLKVIVGPGNGIYDATVTYFKYKDKFKIHTRHIQRINAYGDEPSCIMEESPHLIMFCYCTSYYKRHNKNGATNSSKPHQKQKVL